MAEINVVPYIDVMLVLLVIFMITAPLLTQGVKVELAEADARPIEEDAKRPLVVSVEADGAWSITYDDDRIQQVDEEALLLKSAAIIKNNPGIPVLIKGDKKVVITELPYQLSKAGWIEKLAEQVNDGKISGIARFGVFVKLDETGADGLVVTLLEPSAGRRPCGSARPVPPIRRTPRRSGASPRPARRGLAARFALSARSGR